MQKLFFIFFFFFFIWDRKLELCILMYNSEKVLDRKYHWDLQVFFTADILTPLSRKSTAAAHSNTVVRHNSVSIWRLQWTWNWNNSKEYSHHSFFMFTCAFPAVTCQNVFNENGWLDCSRPAMPHLSTIFCWSWFLVSPGIHTLQHSAYIRSRPRTHAFFKKGF